MLAWCILSLTSQTGREERNEVPAKQIEWKKHLIDWKRARILKRMGSEWYRYDVRQLSCLCFFLSASATHKPIAWLNLILMPLILQAWKKNSSSMYIILCITVLNTRQGYSQLYFFVIVFLRDTAEWQNVIFSICVKKEALTETKHSSCRARIRLRTYIYSHKEPYVFYW